jgi:saccharopine dehydrogenase-like NADP-dependent oxidoreductase
MFQTIAVLGLGKIGLLTARMLHDGGLQVLSYDRLPVGEELPFEFQIADVSSQAELDRICGSCEAVLSCLPYQLNLQIAAAAHRAGIHYFDLTEDVATTNAVIEMAKTANGVMVPQCGLAPGFVGIVAASLIESFESCRACRMRVGALPQNPTGLMGYAFNWSPEGVVNEYLNDCEVIEDGIRKLVSPMEWCETLYIDGIKFEAFTTSGGIGTMCETYLGKVANIDYKSIRYPGHMQLMNFFFHELLMRENRAEAGKVLVNAKPPVDLDVVYVHISAEGVSDGQLRRKEFVRSYRPRRLLGDGRRAIAWTTSASAVAVIDLVRSGVLPSRGFIRQETIPLNAFLATRSGGLYAE